jgi:hypothetical protein
MENLTDAEALDISNWHLLAGEPLPDNGPAHRR